MIDFSDLDKTHLSFVEHDCPEAHRILSQINRMPRANLILNKILSEVIANAIGVSKLTTLTTEEIDVLTLQNVIEKYYMIPAYRRINQYHILYLIKDNKFSTKNNRAMLTEIFGDSIHDEYYMTDLQSVIAKILYAILYI